MIFSIFRCRTLAFLLILACSIAQAAPGRTAVLVASGDPTPDGSDIITNPNNFAYASGHLIFLAYLQNAGLVALFSEGPTAEVEIIRAGSMIAPAGTVTGFAGNLSGNQEGRALFYALTVDGAGT